MSRDPLVLGIVTVGIVLAAAGLAWIGGMVARARIDDPHTAFYTRKAVRLIVMVVALVAIAVVWRPFAGRIGVVVGLTAAGVAFAMQEVIGALAGWANIISGRVYGVGDRVQIGDVHGDVIDVSLLRTTLLEIGAPDGDAWIEARQPTGRIVTVSNKATFRTPVFNYSAAFDYVWEELSVTVPHSADWGAAERVLLEEAKAASSSAGAREAMGRMRRRYPVPPTELAPRTFARASTDGVEVSARMVVPVRASRGAEDDITRRVHSRLMDAGIPFSTEAQPVHVEVDREPGGQA